ncbi:anti-sigma regulatory factor [Streptacidiphilus anmyonensis]|uniref:anti-sigma regulatory factor n=1 Tax=Streptacidiphilus anmyonensis TaxID=405782 RepID=UPI0005AAB880|nr:anti-sigma regulatory factor [Streptacidiphilus anmyonensis]
MTTTGTDTHRGSPTCLPIRSDMDLMWIRQEVRRLATEAQFSLVQQTKLVTAASELARNTLVHGGGGHMEATVLNEGVHTAVRLVFADSGPGIADVDQAMSDGYTSGGGLGLGLGGARRLVHDFRLDSEPGRGTTITVVMWHGGVPPTRQAI